MVINFRFMFWSPNDKIVVPSLHKITILMIVVDRLIRMRFPPHPPFSLIFGNHPFLGSLFLYTSML